MHNETSGEEDRNYIRNLKYGGSARTSASSTASSSGGQESSNSNASRRRAFRPSSMHGVQHLKAQQYYARFIFADTKKSVRFLIYGDYSVSQVKDELWAHVNIEELPEPPEQYSLHYEHVGGFMVELFDESQMMYIVLLILLPTTYYFKP